MGEAVGEQRPARTSDNRSGANKHSASQLCKKTFFGHVRSRYIDVFMGEKNENASRYGGGV
jgi:hypothetical protein